MPDDGNKRRANDGLASETQDTRFAAEVKRVARLRGYSARELAKRSNRNASVVHRQLNEPRRTTWEVAESYAKALDVDALYFGLLAKGKFSSLEDGEPCIQALRTIAADAWPQVRGGSREALWTEIIANLRAEPSTGESVLVEAYLYQTRHEINERFGVREPHSAYSFLRSQLHKIGIDLDKFAKDAPDDILADVWLMLPEVIAENDRASMIGHLRKRLRNRGHFRPIMDELLNEIQQDTTGYFHRRDRAKGST